MVKLFTLGNSDGTKLGINEKTDLGCLIGSSEVSKDYNLDGSLVGISIGK